MVLSSNIAGNSFIGLTKPSLYTQIWVDRSDNHQVYFTTNIFIIFQSHQLNVIRI